MCTCINQAERRSVRAAAHGANKQTRQQAAKTSDNSADMSYSVQAFAVLLQGKLLPYGAGKHRPVTPQRDRRDLVQLLYMKPVSPTACDGHVRARQVAAWCESYRALRAMGFAPEAAGGALTLHPDSLADATEACLAAQ